MLWCVVSRVVVCVRCETLEKPPCVRSKRPRVCRHHAHMLKHMCASCRQTRGRFERTHEVHGRGGGRRQPRIFHRENKQKMNMFMSILNSMLESSFIVSSAYHEWPTCYHLHKRFRHFQFENRPRSTCSRFLQSFVLTMKLWSYSYPEGIVGGNQL